MEYITSVEIIGITKERTEGKLEGEAKLLKKLLEHRFGVLPNWVSEKLTDATEQELESCVEALLTASTLDAVFENDDTSHFKSSSKLAG